MDASTLRELLSREDAPFGFMTDELKDAMRAGRQPARSGYVSLLDVAKYVRQETDEDVDLDVLDRLMVDDLGATRRPYTDLEGLHGRLLNRLIGKTNPRRELYEFSRPG